MNYCKLRNYVNLNFQKMYISCFVRSRIFLPVIIVIGIQVDFGVAEASIKCSQFFTKPAMRLETHLLFDTKAEVENFFRDTNLAASSINQRHIKFTSWEVADLFQQLFVAHRNPDSFIKNIPFLIITPWRKNEPVKLSQQRTGSYSLEGNYTKIRAKMEQLIDLSYEGSIEFSGYHLYLGLMIDSSPTYTYAIEGGLHSSSKKDILQMIDEQSYIIPRKDGSLEYFPNGLRAEISRRYSETFINHTKSFKLYRGGRIEEELAFFKFLQAFSRKETESARLSAELRDAILNNIQIEIDQLVKVDMPKSLEQFRALKQKLVEIIDAPDTPNKQAQTLRFYIEEYMPREQLFFAHHKGLANNFGPAVTISLNSKLFLENFGKNFHVGRDRDGVEVGTVFKTFEQAVAFGDVIESVSN